MKERIKYDEIPLSVDFWLLVLTAVLTILTIFSIGTSWHTNGRINKLEYQEAERKVIQQEQQEALELEDRIQEIIERSKK